RCGARARPRLARRRRTAAGLSSMAARAKDLARRRVAARRRRRAQEAQRNPRMGFFAPLPPAPTGVATYSQAVLGGLKRIGFFDRHRMDVEWPPEPRHEGLVP